MVRCYRFIVSAAPCPGKLKVIPPFVTACRENLDTEPQNRQNSPATAVGEMAELV